MKKLLIFALALMLLLPLLVGCDTAENDPPPVNGETENDTSENDGNGDNDVSPANDGGDEVMGEENDENNGDIAIDNNDDAEQREIFTNILNQYIDQENVRQAFLDVLMGEKEFLVDGEEYYNINKRWGTGMVGLQNTYFSEFAILNMNEHSLLAINNNFTAGVHILFYSSGNVYGIFGTTAAYRDITRNNTYYWGISHQHPQTFGVLEIGFIDYELTSTLLAKYSFCQIEEVVEILYPESQADFDAVFERHNSAEQVVWYELG